jgi:hypothetical protein
LNSKVQETSAGSQDHGILARRLEVKYLVDRTTRSALERDLYRIMQPDYYTAKAGSYVVRSLYFDTPYYMAYHEKQAGSAVRHKLRTRVYGDDPSGWNKVRLEVKSRNQQFIHKRTVDLSRDDYVEVERDLRSYTLPPARMFSNPDFREFVRIQRQYSMEPKIVVQYRRQAFEGQSLGRVRVNFDFDLYSSHNLELLGPLTCGLPLLQYGHAIFEIKVDGALPYWLHALIGKYNLQNEAVSKYCYAVRSGAKISTVYRAG